MIPICIQTIENDDDRDIMEWLFLEYHPLMYATIRKVIHDQWTCEDVLQESVRKFIDHIPQLREMDAASRTNYIVVACRYNAIEEEKRQRRAPFPVGNGVIDIVSRDAEGNGRSCFWTMPMCFGGSGRSWIRGRGSCWRINMS